MTLEERRNPKIIDGSRRLRIANGSGVGTTEVNALLKQFDGMQKMMKGMGAGLLGGGRRKKNKKKKGGRVTPKGGGGLRLPTAGEAAPKKTLRLPGL